MNQPRLALVLLLGALGGALVAVSTANEPGQIPGLWICGCDGLGAPREQPSSAAPSQQAIVPAATYDWSDLAADPRCRTGEEWSWILNQAQEPAVGAIANAPAAPPMSASGGCDTHLGATYGAQAMSMMAEFTHSAIEMWNQARDLVLSTDQEIAQEIAQHERHVCPAGASPMADLAEITRLDRAAFIPVWTETHSPCFVPNYHCQKDLPPEVDLAAVGRSAWTVCVEALGMLQAVIMEKRDALAAKFGDAVASARELTEKADAAWQLARPIMEEARRIPAPQTIETIGL